MAFLNPNQPRIAKIAQPQQQKVRVNLNPSVEPVQEYADFRLGSLEFRENPTDPNKASKQWMIHSRFEDKHNPEVVKVLNDGAIRYEADPETGQQIPVTYVPKTKDSAGKVTEWAIQPMNQKKFEDRKRFQQVPITEHKVLRTMTPAEKYRYKDALLWGNDTSEFYRPIDTSTVPFRRENFHTIDESIANVDEISLNGLDRGYTNIADINLRAPRTNVFEGDTALGERAIMVSDQGYINNQFRQELGENIPFSPELQNTRALMPESDTLPFASLWRTQPQPQNVTQLDGGFRQFDPNEVRGYTTPRAGGLNASPEYVTPSTSIDPIKELWQRNRPGTTPFNSTQDFITPEVLAADAAYQQQLKSSEALQNQTERAGLNQLRNRQVEAIAPQPRAELEEWAIPGVYIPSTQHRLSRNQPMSSTDANGDVDSWQQPQLVSKKLEPYIPKLNASNDDYDWDAFDSDLSMARIELDGDYYPLTPTATVQVAGREVYNNPDEFYSDPDILTAISRKQQELNSIQAKMNELRSSPTARNSEGEGQYNHLMSRAYQLQSGIETATSAHNKLIGLEPLPEVRVTANRLPQTQGTQDPEIEAMYQAGLADRERRQQQRMQEIGMPVTRPRMIESAVNSAPVVVDTPLTAADAVYKKMKVRSWGTPQAVEPAQPSARGIEGSFGRMRSAVPQSMPVAPADPRFVPDPFVGEMPQRSQPQNFSTPMSSSPLMLPPGAEVPVPVAPPAPQPPARSAAEAAFRQWQPQPDAPIAPRQRPQESPSIPSWAAPAAMAGGAGLIGLGGLTAYHRHEQEKQAQREAELRRAMGRG